MIKLGNFICALLIYAFSNLNAQLTVKINDKPINSTQFYSTENLKKIEVNFSNLKKPKLSSFAKVFLKFEFINSKGDQIFEYYLKKEGEPAISNFLNNKAAVYTLYNNTTSKNDFQLRQDGFAPQLIKYLKSQSYSFENLKLQVRVHLVYTDKISPNKWSDPTPLLKSISFKIKNNINSANYFPIQGTDFSLHYDSCHSSCFYRQDPDTTNTARVFKLPTTIGAEKILNIISLKTGDFTIDKNLPAGVNEYDNIYITSIDIKDQNQDEAINELKNNFTKFIFWTSNCCGQRKEKLPIMENKEEDAFLQFISDENYSLISPKFCEEENSNWKNETPFNAYSSGKLSGYKFSSVFKESYCKESIEKRKYARHSSIYILKDPIHSNKIVIMFSKGKPREETFERAKKSEIIIEKFISTLVL